MTPAEMEKMAQEAANEIRYWWGSPKATPEDLILVALQSVQRETAKETEKISLEWWQFYKRMHEKSKDGEKDGLYRMFAAEDILRTIRERFSL